MSKALDQLAVIFGLDMTQPSPIIVNTSRWSGIPSIFRDLGYTVGAEIGVYEGRYSAHLFKRIPGLKLYCIDAWLSYSDQHEIHTPEIMERRYEETKRRLAPFNPTNIRALSTEAAKMITDESLDFVVQLVRSSPLWKRGLWSGTFGCSSSHPITRQSALSPR